MMETPFAFNSPIFLKSCATSFSVMEEVGSSIIMICALFVTALMISSI